MKTKTNVKAGPTAVEGPRSSHRVQAGMRMKTALKAGPTAVERPR